MEGLYGTDMMAALVDWGSGMETGFSVLQGVSFDIAAVDYAALAAAVEDAAASLSAEDTALLLVGREEDAAGLFAAAGPESPLAGFKWYATDGVVQQASVLADADAATFALSAGLEGFASTWSPSMSVVPQQLAAALMAAELGQAPSPTVLGAWDAAAAVAEVLVGTLGDETSWLHLMVTSNLNHMESVRGGSAAVDENGDASTATYSRFRVGEGPAGAPAWLPEGLYVRTATWGPALVGESARATEEQGVVTLGAVLPITGVNAGYGTGALSAIYLAVEHVNLYNTLVADTGLTFAVDVRDSRSDPAVALAQVQALHDLGVNLVLGPLTSSELAAAADYINDNGMVAIGPLSTAVALAQPDHILRLTANDTHQAHALNRLITEQGRDTVVMLHGDDIYGAGLAEAFAADFTGTVTDIAYPADTTDYADALAAAEAAVAQAADRTRTAVLVVGHGELVGLLESVPAGPLHEVAWYGTDGLALSRELLASPGAVAFARETNLTCSIYDLEARPGLMPMLNVVRTYLEPLVGGEVGWNEFSAYDAVWMAAAAHAVGGVTPDADTLWEGLTSDNSVDNVGLTGFHILDENGDQSDSYYAFYVLSEATGSLGWWSIAWYRDIYGARDELHIYPVYKGNQ